ncbi:MAG: OmpA family protein [Acidobacteriia bacterium]|nr:OmpA family protein [Terriglobia bacterium]
MKTRFWIALPLAALLIIPAAAQTSPSSSKNMTPPAPLAQNDPSAQQNPASQQDQASPSTLPTSSQQTPDQKAADQNLQARQPLTAERHEGFWGKINPFARKKYVQRQLSPVRDRVNELDELTAANAKSIKDVDGRAQQGIQLASNKANEADMHAVDAGNRAQAAQQTATQTSTRIQTVEQVVTNIDQYKPVTQAEIRFRPGQTALSKKAKNALDDMTKDLKDQKGYILEVQGFSGGRGEPAIESSQRMADAVRRYLVINHEIPVYRVHVLGLGNAAIPSSDGTAKRVRGARVEISLLKNDLEQLSAMQPVSSGSSASPAAYQGGSSDAAPQSQPASSPSSEQPAPNMPASDMNPPESTVAPATAQPDSPAPPQPSATPSTLPQQSSPPQQ